MNLNFEQMYERLHFEVPELTWYDFLMFHNIVSKALNDQFKKIKTPLVLYTGSSTTFTLADEVKEITIRNNGEDITIDADSVIDDYIDALQNADKNSFIIYSFSKLIYGVDRLYFKSNGCVYFKDRVSYDELMKNFQYVKNGEYAGMDGSGSILDKQMTTLYMRSSGGVSNNVAKGYTDTGSMTYTGDFAFREGKIYIPYDFMQNYSSPDNLQIFELSADVFRGIDTLTSPSSYVSGTSVYIPDILSALHEASIMLNACRRYNKDISKYSEDVQRLSAMAEYNMREEGYVTDTRREQVWK